MYKIIVSVPTQTCIQVGNVFPTWEDAQEHLSNKQVELAKRGWGDYKIVDMNTNCLVETGMLRKHFSFQHCAAMV